MKTLAMICLGWMASTGTLAAQDPAPPVQDPPPIRVPGRPNSLQELEAFNVLSATLAPADRIRLGQEFLTSYPTSGLTSYVHHILANAFGMADPGRYVYHAEIALQELPESPGLLATLAFIYAETGKTALGAERARAALQLIQALEKPVQLSQSDWLLQKLEIGGQSNYAIGRHLLSMARSDAEPAARLEEAARYFNRGMEQLPDDPYSSFRLGETYLQMENVDRALASFARTAAVGGSIGEIARKRLQELYQAVHSSSDGLSELLANQAVELERARAARKAMLEVMAEPPPPAKPPSTQPPPIR